MIVSLLYKVTWKLLAVPSVLLRSELAKDAELLVLRHENAVLRRQLAAPVRYEPAAAAGLGNATTYRLRDLWSKTETTTAGAITASIPAHGTVVYRVSRQGVFTAPAAGTTHVSDLTPSLSSNAWGPVERIAATANREPVTAAR